MFTTMVQVPNGLGLGRWVPPRDAYASGSTLVAALERAYGAVRSEYPELPDAVIITGSGLSGYGLVWGHFARDRWTDAIKHGRRPELFVGGERMATGAVLVMQTLLHECAHALAVARDIQDTSRGHRYHNRRFVALAETLGLEYTHAGPDATIGFSAVTLTKPGRVRWSAQIRDLERAITLGLDLPGWAGGTGGLGLTGGTGGGGGHGLPVRRGKGTGGASYVKATCKCEPARVIRVSRSTLTGPEITCGECEATFEDRG